MLPTVECAAAVSCTEWVLILLLLGVGNAAAGPDVRLVAGDSVRAAGFPRLMKRGRSANDDTKSTRVSADGKGHPDVLLLTMCGVAQACSETCS